VSNEAASVGDLFPHPRRAVARRRSSRPSASRWGPALKRSNQRREKFANRACHQVRGFERFTQAREMCAVSFGFIASLIIVILAVLSVFVEIQIVTNYAFWFVIGAYIMLAGACFD
jgi:hypothetical protein